MTILMKGKISRFWPLGSGKYDGRREKKEKKKKKKKKKKRREEGIRKEKRKVKVYVRNLGMNLRMELFVWNFGRIVYGFVWILVWRFGIPHFV